MEISLALLKPHVVRNTYALQQLKTQIESNFNILAAKDLRITKELSECFYAEHKDKFFYYRLTSLMQRYSIFIYIKHFQHIPFLAVSATLSYCNLNHVYKNGVILWGPPRFLERSIPNRSAYVLSMVYQTLAMLAMDQTALSLRCERLP